ncbi:hypothetical protein KIN20_013040 [Parelaphostrongylus tenuis]|uniref:Uncharacterized protein n=1 Tax=Parelaphostrongylus tenuis TaxID=148309 RepID=A0AAD5MVK6_PARTN|nr:hypothetical protein KIN20_013040 [Parelaphostrongylus tenuis]
MMACILKEALVRPLVHGLQKFSLLFTALGNIAPRSCSIRYHGATLSHHRIDPKVHDELLLKFGSANEENFLKNANGLKDSKNTVNVSDIGLVDATSNPAQLINLLYANETFGEVATVNDTLGAENTIVRSLSDTSLGSMNITEGQIFGNTLAQESGEFGEVIFRQNLAVGTSTFEFTPNISGTLHCRIIPMD